MASIAMQQTFESVHEPQSAPRASPAKSPQELLLNMGLAYIASASLNTAVKLRIPDLIGTDSKDVDILALESGTDPDYLYRILRVLEANQIVTRTAARSYKLTDAGQLVAAALGDLGDHTSSFVELDRQHAVEPLAQGFGRFALDGSEVHGGRFPDARGGCYIRCHDDETRCTAGTDAGVGLCAGVFLGRSR